MKRRLLTLLVVFLMVQVVGCGGGGDPLKGTWIGEGEFGKVIWTFDGKGKCTMENEFLKQDGEYSVEKDQLKVKLQTWDKEQVHTFTVKDDALSFGPVDPSTYAPSYKDLKKQK